MTTIAVIGAGFSGTLFALHALRRSPPGTLLCLIERHRQFGRGQAYATGNASHLLNVPAGRMSAFHDQPRHFLDWLQAQPAGPDDAAPTERSFVPRQIFGAYVRALLAEEMKRPDSGDRLDLVRADVQAIRRTEAGLDLVLDRDRSLQADIVVLATGNFPPEPPPIADPGFFDSACYRADPWAPDALADLDPAAPVFLIGTGLTMVDAVVSLLDQGHTGPIQAVSRRGLLPLRHTAATVAPQTPDEPFPTSINALLRFLRENATRAEAQCGSWQPTIDSLRPFTQDVWQTMTEADRRRFLRHLRPWWDIHRHRMAAAVADRIEAARAVGQLCTAAGRIRSMRAVGDGAEIVYRPKGTETLLTHRAARVVNCSGPGADYQRIAHPLIRTLLADGLVRPDPLRLSLDVTGTCALRDANGGISRRLFAVGPITKAAFWEMTAVPDIRRQCEFLATHVAGLCEPLAAVPARAERAG